MSIIIYNLYNNLNNYLNNNLYVNLYNNLYNNLNNYELFSYVEEKYNVDIGIHLNGMTVKNYYDSNKKLVCSSGYNGNTGQVGNIYISNNNNNKICLNHMLKDIINEVKTNYPNTPIIWESLCGYPDIWVENGATLEYTVKLDHISHQYLYKLHPLYRNKEIGTSNKELNGKYMCVIKIN